METFLSDEGRKSRKVFAIHIGSTPIFITLPTHSVHLYISLGVIQYYVYIYKYVRSMHLQEMKGPVWKQVWQWIFKRIRNRRKSVSFFKIGLTIHPHGLNEWFSFIWSLHSFCFSVQYACADKSGDFSPFHSIVYVHPPLAYSDRL